MSDKAYEDVSDDDIRALAEEHRKFREQDRVTLAAGVYRTRVKSQKPVGDVPERGIFAGQPQTLLTHAVLDKNGDEVLGAVLFNRMALPLTAPEKVSTQKGRSIAFSNILKLQGAQDAEDGEAAAKAAIAAAQASLDGGTPFVDCECFLRVEYEPYVDKNTGEQKSSQRVRIAQFLKKGEELADLPGQSNSDRFEILCDD